MLLLWNNSHLSTPKPIEILTRHFGPTLGFKLCLNRTFSPALSRPYHLQTPTWPFCPTPELVIWKGKCFYLKKLKMLSQSSRGHQNICLNIHSWTFWLFYIIKEFWKAHLVLYKLHRWLDIGSFHKSSSRKCTHEALLLRESCLS